MKGHVAKIAHDQYGSSVGIGEACVFPSSFSLLTIELLFSVLDVGLLTVFFFSFFFQFLGSVISVTDDTKLVTKVGLWVS